MPGGRAGTPGASYERTTKEQESQEDREAILDRQRLRTNHLTPRQRWVPQLVYDKNIRVYRKYYRPTAMSQGKFNPN